MPDADPTLNAWNPGLTSEIPSRLQAQVTLYRPENSDIGFREAREAAQFCGLKPQDMVAFRLQRLVVHEVLIRVTADLHVLDGPNYEDLGLSLRGMTARIIDSHVQPRIAALEGAFEAFRGDVEAQLGAVLDRDIFARPPAQQPEPQGGLFGRLFARKADPVPEPDPPELTAPRTWRAQASKLAPGLERACLEALASVVAGIVGQRGRLMADKALLIRLAARLVCNAHGSELVGNLLDPIIRDAAAAEGYDYLPYQSAPVVLNVKGASAAGKSTIRPLQRKLADRLGVPWEHFALVSPDYWRKYLLDYDGLGADVKYAGMLTGQELEIIDKKLDGYMERKATRSQMPHLLIDRFRFDSFATSTAQPADSRLLSRFGDRVFMFFIITPPVETVERAWKRGLTTGRFKAVDDLLYHNIEAYTGMPQLFFTWVKKDRHTLHFEFLDNSVPLGDQPRTVAFGWNDRITILDPDCLRQMNRYRHVNVEARRPQDVLLDTANSAEDIILDCIATVSEVTFLDPATLTVVGHTKDGKADLDVDGFLARSSIALEVAGGASSASAGPSIDVEYERRFTVGAWAD